MEEMRDTFGRKLVELGREYQNLYVLDADLNTSTKTDNFLKEFPSRFIQVGVAEQNMIGIAAGLSLEGKIPFACTFADFLTKRACDQISISIAYPKINVKLVGAYPGLFTGKAGATHQSVQDLSNMRAMPNMTVIAPCDNNELCQAMEKIVEYNGPVYFRVPRIAVDNIIPEGIKFEFGKGVLIKEGNDVTLVSTGIGSQWAYEAAEKLIKQGIHPTLIHMPVLKPIDRQILIDSAKRTNKVVTVENHSIIGGLGSAVMEILAEEYPVLVNRIGIKDQFTETGEDNELIIKYKLTPEHIVESVKRLLEGDHYFC